MVRRFYTIYEQKFSNLRPFLVITFPQGFQKSKKFGHWTLGSGGKNTKIKISTWIDGFEAKSTAAM